MKNKILIAVCSIIIIILLLPACSIDVNTGTQKEYSWTVTVNYSYSKEGNGRGIKRYRVYALDSTTAEQKAKRIFELEYDRYYFVYANAIRSLFLFSF
jgi:hypothetical protein